MDFGPSNPYFLVEDMFGEEISLTQVVTPGVPAQFSLNANPTEFDTAEMNAQRQIILFREYIRSISPGDATFDFPVLARVNHDLTCGAYFDGSSINFFRAQGLCANTAYSTVIAHEEGHWAVNRYQGGASGAFHEGAADAWAMYIHDTPLVGEDLCGSGCYVRDGNNGRQKCGPGCDETCHGGAPQTEGEVLMGVLWKVRKRLNIALGDAAGDIVADSLFLGWFQAFDDSQICDEIYTHILILDDDDGNLGNGTPHCHIIEAAFEGDHGWPDIHDCGSTPDCPQPCEAATTYGEGTAGSEFLIPQISTPSGCAFLGNQLFALMVDNVLGGAVGTFILGSDPDDVDLGGWRLLVSLDSPRFFFPFVTSGSEPGEGDAVLTLGIPDDPAFDDFTLYAQAILLDPGAVAGVAASEGLEFRICDPR